jgi:DNA-damage-inducible protein J
MAAQTRVQHPRDPGSGDATVVPLTTPGGVRYAIAFGRGDRERGLPEYPADLTLTICTTILRISIEIRKTAMAQTSMLHVRLDDDIKAKGNAALAAMGLSAADAVRLLYHRIIAEQAFPLELKVPNATTRAAIGRSRNYPCENGRHGSKGGDAMIADLEA